MKVGAVYVEEEVADHPRARAILARIPAAVPRIPCARWGEVMNVRAQSFRLQKRRPALVLARKHDRRVLPAPEGYGLGGRRNFYLSLTLNCPYDCRYCFLQGMVRSAHWVAFVNLEDFVADLAATAAAGAGEPSWFFAGYDADSLALDGLTGQLRDFLPAVAALPLAHLELRTKSASVAPLVAATPWERAVVAWSFTPHPRLEPGVPSLARRLAALRRVALRGWKIGLRFDPLIWSEGFRAAYERLFDAVFAAVPAGSLHSVSLGPFRLPSGFFRAVARLYPEEPLLAGPLLDRGGLVSYRPELEAEIVGFVTARLAERVPVETLFPCSTVRGAAA